MGEPVYAGPSGGEVVSGTVDIVQSSPTELDIKQGSDKAIIDWRSFSIDRDELVRFLQPSSSSITLNRVKGTKPTYILGQLTANGQILLINSNGILFGDTAIIDVGGLVATTIDIRDEDFLDDRLNFSVTGDPGGTVVNRGEITVAEGGLAALVAPGVENSGVIRARLGRVALASGNSFTLDLHGDDLIQIEISDRVAERLFAPDGTELKALVGNSGVIGADGGTVVLLAVGAAKGVVDYAINMDGIVEARSAEKRNGQIILRGAGEGVVRVSGTIDASGRSGGGGGSVKVLGEKVGVVGKARIDASGDSGGGEILVGGNFQGRGPERNADYTTVGSDAIIQADAVTAGNGGRVIVWSDKVTRFFGTVAARGGVTSGDGGFAEVSGKQYLQFAPAKIDLGASNGLTGDLLLDPQDIVISTATNNNNSEVTGDSTINFGDGTATETFTINPSAFQDIVGNVTLQAERDITVSNAIARTASSAGTLTLQAGRHLTISANISSTNSTYGLILEADSPRSSSNDGIGTLTIGSGVTVNSNNGNITLIGAAFDFSGTVNAGTGNIHVAPSRATAITIGTDTTDLLSKTKIGKLTTSGTIRIGTATTGPTGSGGAGSSISAISITVSDEALTISGGASLEFDSGGTTTLEQNVTTADGAITFSDAVTLSANVIVDSDSDADAMDGAISFTSTVRGGGRTLTIDADTGSVTVGGTIGSAGARLTSLSMTGSAVSLKGVRTTGAISVSGSTSITLNGIYGSNDGDVTFTGPVTLAADVTVNSDEDTDTTDGAVSFSSTVSGSGLTLVVDAGTGSVTFSGAVGTTTARLTVLTVDGGQVDLNSVATSGVIDIDGSNIDLNGGSYTSTGGDIHFRAAVDLHANVTAGSGPGGGDIWFHGTVGGAHNLAVDAGTGSVTFLGAVTLTGSGALSVSGDGGITLNANVSTADGAITFSDAVTLSANVTVDSDSDTDTTDGAISFTSTVSGSGRTLTVDADTGNVTVGGNIGTSIAGLSSLSVTGGAVSLKGVMTTGAITVSGSTSITLNGIYGSDNGAISFTGAVTLAANVTVGSGPGGGNISFSSTVGAGHSLAVDAGTGSVTFSGAVGTTTTRLTSLTVDGGQVDLNAVATSGVIDIDGTNIDLNGGSYTSTGGAIDFRSAVDLHANVTVGSGSGGGNIRFHGTVGGGHNLTVDAGTGSVTFSGAVALTGSGCSVRVR